MAFVSVETCVVYDMKKTQSNTNRLNGNKGYYFGEWLVNKELLSRRKLCEALTDQNTHGGRLGEVLERLGFPGKPGVDMLTVIRSFNLAEKFEPEVLAEAETVAAASFGKELETRIDYTQDCVYTIDPADARDHDDAISVERTEFGFRLGVHIADVSFYVQPGTDLDREAFSRGNSVYLPGRVVPMLPEVLSNDICSLKLNKTRLAHSVQIDFDKRGKPLKWERQDSVIKSKAKLY